MSKCLKTAITFFSSHHTCSRPKSNNINHWLCIEHSSNYLLIDVHANEYYISKYMDMAECTINFIPNFCDISASLFKGPI